MKSCSFFGHRNTVLTNWQTKQLTMLLENLILKEGVDCFLFGSKSSFNTICLNIITTLKKKYPHITRIAYTCKSESCTLEEEREHWERIYSNFANEKVELLGVEQEFEHKNKYLAGIAGYIERNYAMIDASCVCVFYYNEKYKPQKRKQNLRCAFEYQPNSGTALAFKYATKNGKRIINIYE